VFLRCCTEYVGLVHRLGVENDVVLQPRLEIPVLAPGGRTAWLRRNGLPPRFIWPGRCFASVTSALATRPARPAVLALRRLRLEDQALDEQTFGAWLAGHGQSAAAVDALWD